MNIPALGSPSALKPDDRAIPAPVPPARAPDSSSAPPSREQVAAAVKRINAAMPAAAQSLEFSIDEDSKETIVKIVDQNTKEVVRQIPSVEALAIAKSLDKMMGLLINQKA
jgi:flagellar protein FlaG